MGREARRRSRLRRTPSHSAVAPCDNRQRQETFTARAASRRRPKATANWRESREGRENEHRARRPRLHRNLAGSVRRQERKDYANHGENDCACEIQPTRPSRPGHTGRNSDYPKDARQNNQCDAQTRPSRRHNQRQNADARLIALSVFGVFGCLASPRGVSTSLVLWRMCRAGFELRWRVNGDSPRHRAGRLRSAACGYASRVPRVTMSARRVAPDSSDPVSTRQRLLNGGIVLLLIYFFVLVVVSIIAWVALANQ
jgi:hypothetical protein